MMPRKIPLRRCMGCNESKPKKELVRVVRTSTGEILLDTTGRTPGRGAYVCPCEACFTKARRAKRFERALECEIPEAVYDAMLARIAQEGSHAG